MRILPHEQLSPEWFAAKAGVISASSVADLMAKTKSGPSTSRKNYITQLAVERITGTRDEGYSNAAMQRGIALEPEARAEYERLRCVLVEEVGFALHDVMDYAGASMDGLVGDDGLLEIKCPTAMAKHAEALRNGAHAAEYRWQVMAQLWISGRAWCDVASFDPRFPEGLQLAITRVHRDEKAIAELVSECTAAEIEIRELVDELQNMRKAA